MLAGLDVKVVIPGHGEPFTAAAAAIERARGRLESFARDSLRIARHALKVNLMFTLLERQRIALADLPAHLERVGLYREFNALFFRLPPTRVCGDARRASSRSPERRSASRALSRRLGRDFARMADPRFDRQVRDEAVARGGRNESTDPLFTVGFAGSPTVNNNDAASRVSPRCGPGSGPDGLPHPDVNALLDHPAVQGGAAPLRCSPPGRSDLRAHALCLDRDRSPRTRRWWR